MYTDEKLIAESSAFRRALIDLVVSIKPTHFATMAINHEKSIYMKKNDKYEVKRLLHPDLSIEARNRLLKHFHSNLEQNIFRTKYFYKMPKEMRVQSICFPEHSNRNIHYHGLFVIPDIFQSNVEFEAIKAWQKVCKKGTIQMVKLQSPEDIYRTTNYSLKEIYKQQNYESFVIASEFWKPSSRVQ